MKKNYLLPLIFALANNSYAQLSSLSGYVYDQTNHERLIGVSIFLPELKTGAITSENGYYVIPRLKEGTYKATFSYIGYENFTAEIKLAKGEKKYLDVNLKPTQTNIEEIVISAEAEEVSISEKLYKKPISQVSIKPKDLETMPQFVEADLLRSLQTLPGVVAVSDFSSALYVRGGTPDQNLILLDGTDVYNPEHAFGIFSAFDMETIKQADLYKGGYPSEYGGRLSSVLNIINKDGNRENFDGAVSVSALSSKANLEAPLGKIGSISLSGRRTYLSETIGLFVKDLPDYYFYDGSAKAFFDLGQKDKLILSAYGGRDFLDFTLDPDNPNSSKFKYDWGNKTFSSNFNHVFSPTLYSSFWLTYSRFTSDFSIGGIEFSERNKIHDLSVKTNFTYLYSDKHAFKTGLELKFLNLYYFQDWNKTLEVKVDKNKTLLSFFAKHEWKATDLLFVDYGFRGNSYLTGNTTYSDLGPRISAKYRYSTETTFKASAGYFYQYLHRLPRFIVSDVWTSSDANYGPSNSKHLIFGLTSEIFKDYEFETEVYYKSYNKILSSKNNSNYDGRPTSRETRTDDFGNEYQVSVYTNTVGLYDEGKGRTYGGEVMLKKSAGNSTGWIAYTYSNTKYKITNVNSENFYSPRHDRPHVVNFVLNQGLWKSEKSKRKNLVLGLNFIYGSGQPITLPAKYVYAELGPGTNSRRDIYYPFDKNGFRLPAYARLDGSLTWNVNNWSWYLQIYNLGNRKNVWAVFYETEVREEGEETTNNAKINVVSMIPFFPSIGVKYSF
ncbi:TonB-dependent receptor [bacterium]|nr:TonB-dependent receptor [bacterium]